VRSHARSGAGARPLPQVSNNEPVDGFLIQAGQCQVSLEGPLHLHESYDWKTTDTSASASSLAALINDFILFSWLPAAVHLSAGDYADWPGGLRSADGTRRCAPLSGLLCPLLGSAFPLPVRYFSMRGRRRLLRRGPELRCTPS